jgi:amidophosphoribosyltransferase
VATGSAGFANLGMGLVKDIRSEIVILKEGEIADIVPLDPSPACSFMWVYTAFPFDRFREVSASEIRKRLGAKLAIRDASSGFIPDIVVPVPDSGRFHAIGYHQAFIRMKNEGSIDKAPLYDEVLSKYPYAGRSFTPQSKEIRELEASIKQVPSGEDYQGIKAVVVDDSIVRGTQAQNNLVPKLRATGLEEIHLRVGNPELRSYCPWGKSTKEGETLVDLMPNIEDRRKYLGVDSLVYNSIQDLEDVFRILGKEELCMDCSKGGI